MILERYCYNINIRVVALPASGSFFSIVMKSHCV